jgi:hypothetical protein
MTTQRKSTNWFVTIAAAAGVTLSLVAPAFAHGGGGGGMGHMGTSSMSRSSIGSSSRGTSLFKNGNALSSKNVTSLKGKNITTSAVNTKLNVTSPLNTTQLSTQPTTKSLVVLNTKLFNTNTKVITATNPGSNIVKTGIGNLSNTSVLGKTGGPITVPPGGFKTLPASGKCWPYPGGWYGPFGGLGLLPYLYGSGIYGAFGGGYSGYGGGYSGTTIANASSAIEPVAANPPAAPATLAATPAAVEGIDLQLVDVRMLDNGDAAQQIGPRYRVTFRNAGTKPVDHEFNVALVAADDANLSANLPTAESRITSVPTARATTVDVRLPVTAFQMGTDSKSEFGKLFVFVDSRGELSDVNRDNNAAGLDRTAIQPAT